MLLQLIDIRIESQLNGKMTQILQQYCKEGLLKESSTGEYIRVQEVQNLGER